VLHAGPGTSEAQQAAVAAACSAATAVLPLMLAEKLELLPQLLWSYQQLMLACKVRYVKIKSEDEDK
jgi:hypothetical protein